MYMYDRKLWIHNMLITAKEKLTGQIAYLVKNRKLCFEPATNCLLDIFIAARLLTSKLITWECKYLKACMQEWKEAKEMR